MNLELKYVKYNTYVYTVHECHSYFITHYSLQRLALEYTQLLPLIQTLEMLGV